MCIGRRCSLSLSGGLWALQWLWPPLVQWLLKVKLFACARSLVLRIHAATHGSCCCSGACAVGACAAVNQTIMHVSSPTVAMHSCVYIVPHDAMRAFTVDSARMLGLSP